MAEMSSCAIRIVLEDGLGVMSEMEFDFDTVDEAEAAMAELIDYMMDR
jgi:hypothetical protein